MDRKKIAIGNRYGSLIVLERAEDHVCPNGRKRAMYLCKCDCGNTKIIYAENLTGGKTLSCGCLQKRRTIEASITHGESNSKLYGVWCSMKRRCDLPTARYYNNYGGRGIRVCDEWHDDYSAFMKWSIAAGYHESERRGDCTLDRIDVNGDYSPDNCRWVDQIIQMNNVRYNRIVEYDGVKYTIAELARATGVPYQRLSQRICIYGWDVSDAVNRPPKK